MMLYLIRHPNSMQYLAIDLDKVIAFQLVQTTNNSNPQLNTGRLLAITAGPTIALCDGTWDECVKEFNLLMAQLGAKFEKVRAAEGIEVGTILTDNDGRRYQVTGVDWVWNDGQPVSTLTLHPVFIESTTEVAAEVPPPEGGVG